MAASLAPDGVSLQRPETHPVAWPRARSMFRFVLVAKVLDMPLATMDYPYGRQREGRVSRLGAPVSMGSFFICLSAYPGLSYETRRPTDIRQQQWHQVVLVTLCDRCYNRSGMQV